MLNAVESQGLAEAANLVSTGANYSAYGIRGKSFALYAAEQIAQQAENGEANIINHMKSTLIGMPSLERTQPGLPAQWSNLNEALALAAATTARLSRLQPQGGQNAPAVAPPSAWARRVPRLLHPHRPSPARRNAVDPMHRVRISIQNGCPGDPWSTSAIHPVQ